MVKPVLHGCFAHFTINSLSAQEKTISLSQYLTIFVFQNTCTGTLRFMSASTSRFLLHWLSFPCLIFQLYLLMYIVCLRNHQKQFQRLQTSKSFGGVPPDPPSLTDCVCAISITFPSWKKNIVLPYMHFNYCNYVAINSNITPYPPLQNSCRVKPTKPMATKLLLYLSWFSKTGNVPIHDVSVFLFATVYKLHPTDYLDYVIGSFHMKSPALRKWPLQNSTKLGV